MVATSSKKESAPPTAASPTIKAVSEGGWRAMNVVNSLDSKRYMHGTSSSSPDKAVPNTRANGCRPLP